MIDWKSKFTSRKFWAALASFVTLLIVAFGGNQSAAAQVTEIIMAGASVIAYIIGEGLVDAASVGNVLNQSVSGDYSAVTTKGKASSDQPTSTAVQEANMSSDNSSN